MKKPEVLARQCADLKARNLGIAIITSGPQWKEPHFRVEELAELWGLSKDTITKMFEHEPGVWDASENPNGRKDRRKRRHRMLMIPESVVQRVRNSRLTKVA